ncbi:hypothetical protein AB0Q95_06695 [Streptomyces sp. NPDC059900]|uniref:hypothetical protein n=1 Tax=Streptomyces sp. NPDC059900 TaxID=3155816 RepID=UPI003423AE64
MFSLRHTAAVRVVWDSLPDGARREFEDALWLACEDPYKNTRPRSKDEHDVERILALQHTVVAILLIDAKPVQRLYVRSLDYVE